MKKLILTLILLVISTVIILAQPKTTSETVSFFHNLYEMDNKNRHAELVSNSAVKIKINPDLSKGKQTLDTVIFNDPNLEQVIRDVLKKPTGEIYDTDMATLISLTATYKDISDLTGLGYGVNLTEIDLRGNKITYIS